MKRALTLTLIVGLIMPFVIMVMEPEKVDAVADEVTVTAEVGEEISISAVGDILLLSSIPGMTGNPGAPASGSGTWTVITSNATGFNLKVKASGETGMLQSASSYFYAYTPAAAGSADYDWATPAAGSAEYGFSVTASTATDIDTPFTNDGGACGAGALNTDNQCWFPFALVDLQVINRTTSTSGVAEKINFRAESNGMFLNEGYYDSYVIVTATIN